METERRKKWRRGAGALAVCFMLTGCCMSHEWKEATCAEPKTCAECGKTEGEALGHTWVDATCAEPKHCNLCGETEGEALAHTWVEATCAEPKRCSVCGATEGNTLEHALTEANYQQAAVCEVCGETAGEPLQADFEKYNFSYVTETDKEYQFVNKCNSSDDLTNGKIIFSDYQTFASDDKHEAQEGYEWKTIIYTIIFDDDNAYKQGQAGYLYIPGDFYNLESYLNGDDNNGDSIFIVNYNGINYTECKDKIEDLTNWEDVWVEKDDGTYYYKSQKQYSCCVPVGYDGMTISIMNYETGENLDDKTGGSVHSLEDAMIYLEDENTITFRLK